MEAQSLETFFMTYRIAETQSILNSTNKYQELGFVRSEDDGPVELFRSTWTKHASSFNLGDLPKLPRLSVLKKDGLTHLSLEFSPRLSVIVNLPVVNHFANSVHISGNEVEHILLSRDRQSLDLLSVIRKPKIYCSIFSFFGSGLYAPNEHQGKPIVFIPIKFVADHYDEEDFVYRCLHEMSHGFLADVHEGHIGQGFTLAQRERQVNANVLQAIRQLTIKYPNQQFIDPNGFTKWAENQLSTNYDNPEYRREEGLDYHASNQVRKEKRRNRVNY